ncbi:MAG: DUF2849 domain-containing protein [Alphaproteobacteria bacterium]|jgi:hypothetical protein|nr:DUF2849 domain-containing protein [Alphaproteobacteria bacterium]MDP6563530.1 DUF2849 domain-containing protein [Alphaproteobacteria bacterium]|tara:strand:+ start:519 stop:818 length:300 start_codon:yes stop_codon:yes gene_type:complete
MTQKAVTANRLHDGFVVYLSADGGWSERIADCRLARDGDEERRLLAAAEQDAALGRVIGPYTFAVEVSERQIRPLGQREILRTLGPSVRTDLGYQAIGA